MLLSPVIDPDWTIGNNCRASECATQASRLSLGKGFRCALCVSHVCAMLYLLQMRQEACIHSVCGCALAWYVCRGCMWLCVGVLCLLWVFAVVCGCGCCGGGLVFHGVHVCSASQWSMFFASYRSWLEPYITATAAHIDLLSIGAELQTAAMEGPTKSWEDLCTWARSITGGTVPLTYAAMTSTLQAWDRVPWLQHVTLFWLCDASPRSQNDGRHC